MNPNMPHQQGQQQGQQQGGFCGVPGADLAAMAQAAWGQMDGGGGQQHSYQQQGGLQPHCGGLGGGAVPQGGMLGGADPGMGMGACSAGMGMGGGAGMGGAMVPAGMGGQMAEQASISLSAQAELELELSLRGSLLVQQQRRIVQLEDELQRAWSEIDRLRTKIQAAERDRQRTDEDSSKQPRYWTPDEHRLFMEAVQRFGWKDVKSIAQHVSTRTPTQVRTHAQKLFLRQQKESSGLMQPSKTGRSDLPPGLPPIPDTFGPGGGGSSSADALHSSIGDGDDGEGRYKHDDHDGMGMGIPDDATLANMSNPDADPNAH